MKIIKVGALWCSACLVTNKALKKIKEENNDIEVIEYDYDLDEEEIENLNIGTLLPEIIIYENDNEIKRLKGEKNYKEIKEAIGR